VNVKLDPRPRDPTVPIFKADVKVDIFGGPEKTGTGSATGGDTLIASTNTERSPCASSPPQLEKVIDVEELDATKV